MSNLIEHEGTVIGIIAPGKVSIKIVQLSACVSCKAAKICSAAESKEKIIEAYCDDATMDIGDEAIIYGEAALGHKAVLLALIVPFCILAITLFAVIGATCSETTGGIAAVVALLLYYGVLALSKKKIERTFIFKAKRK